MLIPPCDSHGSLALWASRLQLTDFATGFNWIINKTTFTFFLTMPGD
jgi:hypothetical protein